LAILPLLVFGGMMAYLFLTGGGLKALSGPPIEQLSILRVTLPRTDVIELEVVNDGPESITIAQVMVDEAFWKFHAEPSNTIPRLSSSTITIPYPWVEEETHFITLITTLGATFEAEVPVAVATPQPSITLFIRFGLVGLYVGIFPVALGMLWFPFMRRLSARGMNFVLSLTLGLLIFLAVGTWLDATEFARALPSFWQGVSLVAFVGLLALGALLIIGGLSKGRKNALALSFLIALGIGLHNLGEGLAIGSAFSQGEAALGLFLILGFTLHNITEGVAISAPLVKTPPPIRTFILLILVAGAPAILGVWVGGFSFNPILATIFLAIGLGAILQVVWEVGKLVARESRKLGEPVLNWVNFAGFTTGLAIMYFTAFMVKF
jgi:hypothetical protein